jgi:prepilin-type N-terminal cleavage/methylation domain-containing protein
MPCSRDERGFSLVELAVVLILLGLIAGFAVPAVRHSTRGSQLRATADALSAQLQLVREKAVDTQATLVAHFAPDSLNSDFHVRDGHGAISGQWRLPHGMQYAPGSARTVTFTSDGRASPACYIVLMDPDVHLDTLSVQTSGLVLTR